MAGVAAATWQVAGELERAPGDRARALCLFRRGPSPGTEPARCGAGGPSPARGSGRGARSAVHPRASRWPRAGLACRELLGKLFASLLSAAGLPSPGKCLKLQARKFGEPRAGRPGPAAVSLTCVACQPSKPTDTCQVPRDPSDPSDRLGPQTVALATADQCPSPGSVAWVPWCGEVRSCLI